MHENEPVIHVETREQYDRLMLLLEKQGYMWTSARTPTAIEMFCQYEERTGICLHSNATISYCDIPYFRRLGYTIISFDEYVNPKPKNLNANVIKAIRAVYNSPTR